MIRLATILVSLALLTACQSIDYLGVIHSADGVRTTHVWQTTTKGQMTPVLTTQYSETCVDSVVDFSIEGDTGETKVICGQLQVDGQALGDARASYWMPHMILGGSAAGAARLLRPSQYNSTTTTNVDGVSAAGAHAEQQAVSGSTSVSDSHSNSNSSSQSNSSAVSDQSQGQQQGIIPRNPCI